MRKLIYLFLIIVICIMSMLMASCDNKPMKVSYSQKTGLLDQNGDIVSNTFIYTNSGYVAPELPLTLQNTIEYSFLILKEAVIIL